ncbi:MAG: alpha/beta fold hydrolase [Parcubacteria group bacterium]|nr:alpha/beta fold hydrolase [Parcubacteria group bacterium]
MEKITIQTSDGVGIIGDYYVPSAGSPRGILLVHMMPVTRESWKLLAKRLQSSGYHVLAIDLRGHGGSPGGPEGYKTYTDEQHQKSILDIEAGVEFLKTKGVAEDHLSLIGASIGANLVLQHAAQHGIKNIVLLSPGFDYHGIKSGPLVQKLKNGQRVFFITSQDDDRSGGNNAEMNQLLFERTSDAVDKKILVYKEAGHGTDMFDKEDPDLEEEIITWLTG